MLFTRLKTAANFLAAAVAVAGSAWILPLGSPLVAGEPKDNTVQETHAKLTQIGKLVKPGAGEWSIARIKWETDGWSAATRAAREGKPVITFGGHAGVSGGFC